MNTNELITVVALADDLQVAKQTIFYHCNKLQIEAKKIDNVSYLTHAEAEVIKNRINKNNKHTNNRRDTDKAEATKNNSNNTDQSELVKLLTKQIDDLQQDKQNYERQLQVKDSQIKQLNDTLNNQQSLQLQSNEKIKALEVELKEVKEDSTTQDTTDVSVPAEADTTNQNVKNFYTDLKEDRNNKSFISRLFKHL